MDEHDDGIILMFLLSQALEGAGISVMRCGECLRLGFYVDGDFFFGWTYAVSRLFCCVIPFYLALKPLHKIY